MVTVAEHFGDPNWFAPKDDSEASRVFKAMADTPVEGILSYDDLDRILGRDFKSNRGPWLSALRRWHRDMPQSGTFRCVHRVGYQRVAEWDDVKGTGKHHETKMRRQARKAGSRYKSADQAIMNDDQRREQSELVTRVGRLEQAMRSTKAEIKLLKKSKAETSDLDALREQVEKLVEKVEGIDTEHKLVKRDKTK